LFFIQNHKKAQYTNVFTCFYADINRVIHTFVGCDAVILNDVSRCDLGFKSDENEVLILTPENSIKIEKNSKQKLGRKIIKILSEQIKISCPTILSMTDWYISLALMTDIICAF
jgi:phosphopantothenoylcysteine synthetase/decarboxylase